MCGITGMFDMDGENRLQPDIIQNMLQILKHRGPDAQEVFMDKKACLGFARLSFLDLAGGMQPIFNENKKLVLICNGEIFNFRELRKDLEAKGHVFCSNVDVEVILHLYEQYQEKMLNYLNGQFAFVIYDVEKQEIFCARDHMGIAPFFYTIQDNIFLFASEIKALLEYPGIEKKLNLYAVDQLLTFPGCLAPQTFFEGIHALENGHYMKIRKAEDVVQKEYWDMRFPEEMEDRGEEYYIEKLYTTLDKAIRNRLFADVPIGFYISGGLDSSIIACMIHKHMQTTYHSFAIDFSDRSISEAKYQRIIQRQVKSIHHKKLFTEHDISHYMKSVIYHAETPLRESYDTASMALSEMVHQNQIKAVLTGEGADELFCGYVGYKFDVTRKHQEHFLNEEERNISALVFGDPDFFYERKLADLERVKRKLYASDKAAALDEFSAIKRPLFRDGALRGLDIQQKRNYADYKLRLPEHLLADHGDRMVFANSVEARYPFLDQEMVELALQIPSKYKLNKDLNEKYILKKMARGLVPDQILDRTKFAFVANGVPELIKCEDEYVLDMLSYSNIKRMGIFNADYVEKLKQQYQTEGFKLNLPFDTDYLMFVLTVSIFCNIFME